MGKSLCDYCMERDAHDVFLQWDRDCNGALTSANVTYSSHKKIWWLCEEGHEWRAVVAHRTSASSDCPYCTGRKVLPGFNDLATLYPETVEEWHTELNGSLTPSMVTPGGHKRVWWRCREGHVWKAIIYSRTGTQRSGCPVCAGVVKKRKTAT